MTGGSPTLPQQDFGVRLRKLRTGLCMTVEEVAAKLGCPPDKISRMETAALSPSLQDVRELCAIYGLDEAGTAKLVDLAQQARDEGWWTQYEDLDLYPYIGLEHKAATITHYAMHYVPSLLQTEDYARATIKAVLPGIDQKIVQDRVAARLRRQHLLETEAAPRYHVLLDEAVLHRKVGSAALMAAQLARIVELAQAGKATVQVIPFAAGAYPAADIMFVILEFSGAEPSQVVFVETMTKDLYPDDPAELARYREAFEQQCDLALSPPESVQLLEYKKKAYLNE